jgi:hypothetical protein
MSSPLAMAGVTAVLKDLLNEGLINNELASIGTFTVSALPPDRIQTGANEENRINLFLYQVTPNQGWRNLGMPSTASGGERLTNPPLAIDLHYMLTAYGKEDLSAEVLMGYAMELLHDVPVLGRADIRRSLSPDNPINVNLIPKDENGRSAVDLADQIEQIKIIPVYLSADELSRLWTAMQARFRPTMAYQVSTVIIQRKKPVKSPPPVLARGEKDRGIDSQADLAKPLPKVPTLIGLKIFASQKRADGTEIERLAAELEDVLELEGVLLEGDKITALFQHRLLFETDAQETRIDKPNEIDVKPLQEGHKIRITLPSAATPGTAAEWPPGQYTLALSIERTGKPTVSTNFLPFMLAPRISAAPVVTGNGANRKLTLQFFPDVWKQQLDEKSVEIHVGGHPFAPDPVSQTIKTTDRLSIPIGGVTPSDVPFPVMLRVDGVVNELVRDRKSAIKEFDPIQTVKL